MQKIALLVFVSLLVACDQSAMDTNNDPPLADIKSDETLTFFRTAAWLDEEKQEWHVPIHGWVYEPENSSARKALFEQILKSEFNLPVTNKNEANFSRRLNLLVADNERGKEVTVGIGNDRYILPASGVNGQFSSTLTVSADDVSKNRKGQFLEYETYSEHTPSRRFHGAAQLIGPRGQSIISDIDDTVKISNVTDRRRLLEQTFLLDFAAVRGMSKVYGDWIDENASLHFVSSSPWQLYEPLVEFLDANEFPAATLSLKTVRFRDKTLFNLFKKGTETKPAAIEEILQRYSERRFLLVGDSGEQDPEVYAEFLRKYPEQVLKAYIRNVTDETADNARFTNVFAGISTDRWELFDDPASLESP